MNSNVSEFIEKATAWKNELILLRKLILNCGLTEEYKWRNPCYTIDDKNILFIGGLKDGCVLSFIKGALLKDEKKILIQQTENSNSVRIIKFKNIEEIKKLEAVLKKYILEAIEVEKKGLKIEKTVLKADDFCEELKSFMDNDAVFKKAFESLTPGRQKGYNLFFTSAKQMETRIARIEKNKSRILSGKGIHDCICGHSKKMPMCDGSHKYFD